MRTLLAFLLFAVGAPDWKISMEPVGKVRCNYEAQVEIGVKDAKGAPVTDAKIEVVLTMIGMDHGEFKTAAKEAAGVYRATPTFYMVGKWNVAVHVKKDQREKTENFTYEVKE